MDLLSFANINKSGKNRYYAHVFVGWIFFSKEFTGMTRAVADIARHRVVYHNS